MGRTCGHSQAGLDCIPWEKIGTWGKPCGAHTEAYAARIFELLTQADPGQGSAGIT